METTCSNCKSPNVIFSKKRQVYECEDCGYKFKEEKQFTPLRIFISYGRDEYVALAERLKDDLQKRGHEVWFDKEKLKTGGDWEQYIENGLNWVSEDKDKGRIILIMTPHSVRRPDGFCLNEITMAIIKRLFLIPIMVVFCPPPLSICRIQWLDMTDCFPIELTMAIYERKFNQLLEALELQKIDFEGTNLKLLNTLKPIEFKADILHYTTSFYGRQWIIQDIDKFLEKTNESKVLGIIGPPGVGKTTLSAWLTANRKEICAYHFCNASNIQKRDPLNMISSIAYQLSTQIPEYMNRLMSLNLDFILNNTKDAHVIFDNLITQPISDISIPSDKKVTILIDALDEASVTDRNVIAEIIAQEFPKTPNWLKLIFTSRPNQKVLAHLGGIEQMNLNQDDKKNIEDIRQYVTIRLKKDFKEDEIVSNNIVDKSQGIFLNAKMLCDALLKGELTIDELDKLPKEMSSIYYRFMLKHFSENEYFEHKILPLLTIIIAVVEPVDIKFLKKITGLNGRDFNSAIFSLSPFFLEIDNKLQPYHQSLIEWFTDKNKSYQFYIDKEDGHTKIAEFTISCLNSANVPDYIFKYGAYHVALCKKWNEFSNLSKNEKFYNGCVLFFRDAIIYLEKYKDVLSDFLRYLKENKEVHLIDLLLKELEEVIYLGYFKEIESLISVIETLCITEESKNILTFIKGLVDYHQGNLENSLVTFERIKNWNNNNYIKKVNFYYANAMRESGDYSKAKDIYETIFNDLNDYYQPENLLFAQQFADILYVLGDLQRANKILSDILIKYKENIYLKEIGEVLRIQGHIYRMSEDLETAETLYLKSYKHFNASGSIFGKARIETNLTENYSLIKPDEAIKHGQKAIELNGKISSLVEIGKAYNATGLAYVSMHKFEDAEKNFDRALEFQKKSGYQSGIGMIYCNQVLFFIALKEYQNAYETFLKTMELFKSLKAYPFLIYRTALLLLTTIKDNTIVSEKLRAIITEYSSKIKWLESEQTYQDRISKIYERIIS